MQLSGVHHVTAITANAPGNYRFYTDVLGLRLVKKTVNQDDTSAYHLFFADGLASPGSDLTFFDWPAPRERRGTNAIVGTTLRVAGQRSLEYWASRLRERGVTMSDITLVDGRASLAFEDPEGQRLSLVDDGGVGPAHPWEHSPVPTDCQIRGLGYPVVSIRALQRTDLVLREVFNMRAARTYEAEAMAVHVYEMGDGGRPECELHVRVEASLPVADQGAGGVHHIAFRTPDEAGYSGWTERLRDLRIPSSGPVDRYYFRSLYVREPSGILIEIATDGPGFATDEPLETLGESLALSPFLEPRRAAIEAGLTPLTTTLSHA